MMFQPGRAGSVREAAAGSGDTPWGTTNDVDHAPSHRRRDCIWGCLRAGYISPPSHAVSSSRWIAPSSPLLR